MNLVASVHSWVMAVNETGGDERGKLGMATHDKSTAAGCVISLLGCGSYTARLATYYSIGSYS